MNWCSKMNQEPVSGECLGWINAQCHDVWVNCEQRKGHRIKSLNTKQERWQITESNFQQKKLKEESEVETFWKEKKKFPCKEYKENSLQKDSFPK